MVFIKPPLLQIDLSGDDKRASLSIQSFGDELKFVSNSYQEYKFTDTGLQKVDIQAQPTTRFEQVSEDDIDIQEPLGEGASAAVYKAYNRKSKRVVAIKRINCLEKDRRKQIMNDIRGLCNVSHPSLVEFLGAYRDKSSNQISIVLEYVDGGSLADLVKEGGKIPEEVLAEITTEVLQGLAYLHKTRRTVHRDIKPANILLTMDGHVKIADFGISAFVDNTLAVCNTFLGTVTYMSPERINSRPYSFSADIWSIGLTLLECALGKYPYNAAVGPLILMMQVLKEKAPVPEIGLSEELKDFLQQSLHKDPFQRPTADVLLSHPFLQKHSGKQSRLGSYLASVRNPTPTTRISMYGKCRTKLSCAEKEIKKQSPPQTSLTIAVDRVVEHTRQPDSNCVFEAEIIAKKLFGFLSHWTSNQSSLADIFSPQARLSHEGVEREGRSAVMRHLRKVCELQASLGANLLELQTVDAQPIKDGLVVAHVYGIIKIADAGPLAAAFLENSPPPQFISVLELQQQQDREWLVSKFMFRHI